MVCFRKDLDALDGDGLSLGECGRGGEEKGHLGFGVAFKAGGLSLGDSGAARGGKASARKRALLNYRDPT